MKRLLNCAFVLVALLIAATAAWRSHSSAMSFSATPAATMQAPNAAEREFAATMAPKPVPEIKKPVRYEAIISNWKRYRSTAKSSGSSG
jgi:hypothetical protein